MATTSITDAVVLNADEGTGLSDNTTDAAFDSAASEAILSTGTGVAWHTLTLSNLDTTNETVDVSAGVAWVEMTQSVSLQSAADATYDTSVGAETTPLHCVYLPTSTTVDLDADTDASLRLVVDPTTPDTVTIEHNTSPTDPALVIGSADSATAASDALSNVGPELDAAVTGLQQVTETATSATTGSSYTIDVSSGTVFDLTLDANVTFSFANVPSGVVSSITLVLTQDGTGSRTVTWPAAVDWPGGSAVELSTSAGATDIVMLFTVDGGTTWYAQPAGAGYA